MRLSLSEPFECMVSRCNFILKPHLQPLLLSFSFLMLLHVVLLITLYHGSALTISYAIKLCFVTLHSKLACGHVDCLTFLHSNVFVDIFYLSKDLLVHNYTGDFNKIFPIHFRCVNPISTILPVIHNVANKFMLISDNLCPNPSSISYFNN